MTEPRLIRFLLVEDDDAHAAIMIRSLEQNRVVNQVDRVCDGEEAMNYLRSPDHPRPDVVLLDLNLPKIDGHEVIALVKGDPQLQTIPI
ncbi:MAG: response regulator, partial [Phycisphaeraceae bacterium]|nr:response regulator [Phycisphaeraceae bacterium]